MYLEHTKIIRYREMYVFKCMIFTLVSKKWFPVCALHVATGLGSLQQYAQLTKMTCLLQCNNELAIC